MGRVGDRGGVLGVSGSENDIVGWQGVVVVVLTLRWRGGEGWRRDRGGVVGVGGSGSDDYRVLRGGDSGSGSISGSGSWSGWWG